ncbi:hypothetical protein ACWDHW_44480 [Streptomyces melanosporofaciens]
MTIQDLLKDVSVMDLTAFARAIPSPKDFLLTQAIFPTVEMREVKWRTKDSGRYVNVAKYQAFNVSVPFATREAWQTSREGTLPAPGQKLVVSEQKQILLEASHGSDQGRRSSCCTTTWNGTSRPSDPGWSWPSATYLRTAGSRWSRRTV